MKHLGRRVLVEQDVPEGEQRCVAESTPTSAGSRPDALTSASRRC